MTSGSAESEWRTALRSALARSVKPELVRGLLEGQECPVSELTAFERSVGLTALALPAERGGGGGSARELGIAFEEMGRVLYPGTCLASTLALTVLDMLGSAKLIADVADGMHAGLALGAEPGDPGVRAASGPDGWRLRGHSDAALECGSAEVILVRATTGAGSAIFAVRLPQPGCVITKLPTMDPTRPAWDVTLDNCPAELLGDAGAGDLAWAKFDLLGGFLTAAEAAGGARECLDRAVSYAKERVQFGRPIGQFQAIKHQCADMLVQCEGAKLAVQAAADALVGWTADSALLSDGATGPLDSPRVTVSVAKAYASDTFYRCAATSLHVHGGRGFLWEDDAHLYFRRAITGALQFGDAARHREIIASALAVSAATAGAA
jgi:alkylation response protein AidB-like acyl-CoA dehydrogenase